MDAFFAWWLGTLPPIGGELRVIFLTGLLVLCLVDKPSPLWAAETIRGCDRTFYSPPRILRMFGIRWVQPRVLAAIAIFTIGCWVLAILGLAQPGFAIMTFLGFGFLHAVASGALGSNHSTHSAVYALFCFQFSVSYEWSLDGLISRWTGAGPIVPSESPLHSGFAPTLLLVLLAFTVFAGGIAKLRYGWRGWRTGAALHFYVDRSAPAARWAWASRFLTARPWLCMPAAFMSVAIELGAILAVFSEPLRPWNILSWVALHVAILLVMMPAYWVQMWCYLLLIDWPALFHTGPIVYRPVAGDPWPIVLAVIGTAIAVALVAVLIFEVEQWPFTNVPMYSNGTPSADRVALPERGSLRRRAEAMLRGRQGQWPRAWVDVEAVQDLWLVPADGGVPTPLWHTMADAGVAPVRWSQYAKIVREVTCAQVAAAPSAEPSDVPPASAPATPFLDRVAMVVHRHLPNAERFTEIRLVVETSSGQTTVARHPLGSAGQAAEDAQPETTLERR